MPTRTSLYELVRTRWFQTLLASGTYLAFAIAITWPFAIHPTSSIFGWVPSDLSANISRYQEFVAARQPPFLPGRLLGINAPDGVATTWTLDLASFPSTFVLWTLSVVIGPIAANGVFALASFTLSALAMFLLARSLTDQSSVAFIAGLAYGFWPWVFSTATQPFGHGWLFVVLVWRALVVLERPTVRNGFLMGLAAALSMTWLQYWILIGGVLYATLALSVILVGLTRGDRLRWHLSPQIAAFSVVAVVLLCMGVLAALAAPGEIPERPASDSYTYAARPLMYVVPHPENPIFGRWTGPFLDSRFTGLRPDSPAYQNIYLGLSTLAMAVLGLVWMAVQLRRSGISSVREKRVAAGLVAVATSFVALLFSAPPRVSVAGMQIPMPSEIVLHVTTAFRGPHRFAVVVMLGVCLLAALGLRNVFVKRPARLHIVVVPVLAIVVAVDLWGREIDGSSRVVYSPMYTALKSQPPGIVAVYPLTYIIDNAAVFYRPAHGKRLFNGFRLRTDYSLAKQDFQALRQQRVVEQLATLGVRYVVVSKGATAPWEPRPNERFPGLRPMRSTSDGTVFRVVARPALAAVLAESGFSAAEWIGNTTMRWLVDRKARIELRGACDPCTGWVHFTAASFAQPRTLTIRDSAGKVIAERNVGVTPTTVRFRARFRHRMKLSFTTTPGPQSIQATGIPDPRSVSLQVAVPITFSSTVSG